MEKWDYLLGLKMYIDHWLPVVGGIAELPDVAQAPASHSAPSTGTYAALAGGLAAAVLALGAGAWYARRRWVR